MGPVRGIKKRRKIVITVGQNASDYGSSELEERGDWWVDFSKRISGLLSSSKGLNKFESVFKISRKTFNYICLLVKEDFATKSSNFTFTNGKPLCFNDIVAIALRRLSSSESMLSIGVAIGLNHSTVSQITWRFVEAMEERALHHL